jgi:hypothetical protein
MSATELETLLRAAVPPAPERLRVRVRELRPASRRMPSLGLRRGLVVGVPAIAGVAVVVALVHGLGDSSPRPAAWQAARTVAQRALDRPATAHGAVADSGVAAAPAPALGGGARLTRYEASLRVRVDGTGPLARATSRATALARSLGGYAASVEYLTPAGRPGQALLELRIPAARVQDALARLAGLGTLVSQRVSARDLQRDLERETAQIAQLRQTVTLTLAALKDPAVTPVQRIQLQLRLAEAKRALAQRTHQRGATIAEGTLARVSLVLTTSTHAAAAVHHRGRLGRMVGSAASFLALEGTVALYGLVVVSPLLLLAVLIWAAAWARRRRDEKRLLAVR